MQEKTYLDPEFGPVTLRRNPRARRISLRVVPVTAAFVAAAVGSGGLRSLRSLRPLPTYPASSQSDNLSPSGPSPCPCPGVDTPPDPTAPSTAAARVVITVPWLAPFRAGVAFLEARREWVRKALERQSLAAGRMLETDPLLGEMGYDAYIAMLRKSARKELPPRLAELAALHGFSYGRVFLKHNKSNWGSCSAKGNINLNINLMRLPSELRDYILLHELCHLRELNHGPRFHALLESVCPDHRRLQRAIARWPII